MIYLKFKHRKLILLTALTFFFIINSCQNPQEEVTTSNTDKVIEVDTTEIDTIIVEEIEDEGIEKYILDDITLTISPLESVDCDGLALMDHADEKLLIQEDEMVNRIGDSLQLVLNSGDTLYFIDDTEAHDHWEDYGFKYAFQGSLKGLDYWELWVLGYEYHFTFLIDKNTGREIETAGRPLVSPNKKFVITGNADLDAGYTDNCMYLYEVEAGKLKPKGYASFIYWGPFEMRWIDDESLMIKQGRFNETDYSIDYNCAKVSIEKL